MGNQGYFIIATALYGIAFTSGLFALLKGKGYRDFIVLALIILAYIFQLKGLGLRGVKVESCPLSNVFEVIQFIVWSLVTLHLFIRIILRIKLLVFFCSGFAFVLGVLSLSVPGWDSAYSVSSLDSNHIVRLHASLSIFSYGAFCLLAIVSGMYLLQKKALDDKAFGRFFSFLPSIRDLESSLGRLLLLSLVLYSASVLSGCLYWWKFPESVELYKLLISLFLWGCYFTTWVCFVRRKIYGKQLARCGAWLFILAILILIPIELNRMGLSVGVIQMIH